MGAAGAWQLPHVALIPRGLAAGVARVFDAVDYELGPLTEQQFSTASGTAKHHLLLAAEENAGTRLPEALRPWLAKNPLLTLEAESGRLLLSRGNHSLAPEEVSGLLASARELIGILTRPPS